MEHDEGYVDGPRGNKIYWQAWLRDKSAQEKEASTSDCIGVVVIVHGLAEHSNRYAHVAAYLVEHGYDVFSLDHFGHGQSEGQRCFVQSFDDYIEPLHAYVTRIKQNYPGKPIHMLGHSLGGLITNIYLLRYQQQLTSAVLSGPLVMVKASPTKLQSMIMGFFSRFLPKSGVLQLDARQVCSDPQVVQDYINDPLVHSGKVSARLMSELSAAMVRVLQSAGTITLPIIILQGGKDVMVDPKGARYLFETVSSTKKELKLIDDSYHELLNEPRFKQQAMADIVQWLDHT